MQKRWFSLRHGPNVLCIPFREVTPSKDVYARFLSRMNERGAAPVAPGPPQMEKAQEG